MSSDADRRNLWVSLLIVAFMASEVVVAFVANSFVLLSDPGYMLSDAVPSLARCRRCI